jgi:hypothetical protein
MPVGEYSKQKYYPIKNDDDDENGSTFVKDLNNTLHTMDKIKDYATMGLGIPGMIPASMFAAKGLGLIPQSTAVVRYNNPSHEFRSINGNRNTRPAGYGEPNANEIEFFDGNPYTDFHGNVEDIDFFDGNPYTDFHGEAEESVARELGLSENPSSEPHIEELQATPQGSTLEELEDYFGHYMDEHYMPDSYDRIGFVPSPRQPITPPGERLSDMNRELDSLFADSGVPLEDISIPEIERNAMASSSVHEPITPSEIMPVERRFNARPPEEIFEEHPASFSSASEVIEQPKLSNVWEDVDYVADGLGKAASAVGVGLSGAALSTDIIDAYQDGKVTFDNGVRMADDATNLVSAGISLIPGVGAPLSLALLGGEKFITGMVKAAKAVKDEKESEHVDHLKPGDWLSTVVGSVTPEWMQMDIGSKDWKTYWKDRKEAKKEEKRKEKEEWKHMSAKEKAKRFFFG